MRQLIQPRAACISVMEFCHLVMEKSWNFVMESIWMAVYKQLAPRLSSSTKQILCIKLMIGSHQWSVYEGGPIVPLKKIFVLKYENIFFQTTRGQVLFFHPDTFVATLNGSFENRKLR